MKIKFVDKVYKVLDTKISAGVVWYKIEDEPNHFDWVHNVEICNSEGYGIKKHGNKYPTKPATFK